MRTLRFFTLIILLMLSGMLFSAGTDIGKETRTDCVLVSVNGEPVTLLDVLLETYSAEKRLQAMYKGEELYLRTCELRKRTVEDIINRKLVYEQYKANPFDIQGQHIENLVDMLARTMGDGTRKSLAKRSKAMGSSIEELRGKAKEKIAVDVLIMENCDRRVVVTPKEVYDTYQAHPEAWTMPARLHLQLIQIRKTQNRKPGTPDPAAVVQDLKKLLAKADEDLFIRVAKENSEGPNAALGGDMGWIDADKLRAEFAEALKGLSAGGIAGPVETPEASYFLRLAAVEKTQKIPFEKASRQIEQELFGKAQELRRKAYFQDLRKEAVIKYFF